MAIRPGGIGDPARILISVDLRLGEPDLLIACCGTCAVMGLRGTGVLTLGLTLLGPTDLVQVQKMLANGLTHVLEFEARRIE